MRIHVTAKPGSKKAYVKKVNETHFIVSVTQLPQAGEANEAIIKSLAGYFEIAPSRCQLIFGTKLKHKIIEID